MAERVTDSMTMPDSKHDPNSALAGVKVVEFAHVIAGPLAGTFLADLGADVVHVEAPGFGDTGRRMGPAKDDVHLWWKVAARNKRSVRLDLHDERGRDLARRLIAWADVVITNLRVDTLERWQLDFAAARRVNPRVVYLQVTGYGATSSKRSLPGFGKVGEARSGVVHLTGFADGPPIHTGFSHGDSVAGLMGAYGILAALHRKTTDPAFAGEWVDIALFEPLYRLIEWQVIVQDQLGQTPGRSGNRLSVAPAAVINTYLTAEEDWIVVTSATHRSVLNVVKLLGLPADEFQTVAAQLARADELDAKLAEWVAQRTTRDCLAAMERAQVVASRIFDAADILADNTYAERHDIITVDDGELGPVRMQAVIPHLHQHPGAVWRTGPLLGQDNDLVYRQWLGMPDAEYSDLKAAGVI